MNTREKNVLRRKRHLLGMNLVIDESISRELTDRGLMTDVIADQLRIDMTNYGRTTRYLDLLMKLSTNVNAFQALCSFLDYAGHNPWLGDELRTELKAETGELVIDEYVRKEASEIVHIHFGGKKRMSEREKNILEGLIAQRTQCAKEVWRTNFETTKRELELQAGAMSKRNIELTNTIGKIADYIENHRNKIFRVSMASNSLKHSLAKRSAIQSLEDSLSHHGWSADTSKILVEKLNQGVEELHALTSMFTAQYENLVDEKMRALTVLRAAKGSSADGVLSSKYDDTVRLDVELATLVEKVKKQLNGSQIKVKELEQKSKMSDERRRAIERECEEDVKRKESTIRVLADKLDSVQRSLATVESELHDSNRQLESERLELKRFKSRSIYLERSRHLGYMYDSLTSTDRDAREREMASDRIRYAGGRDGGRGSNVSLPRIKSSSMDSINDGVGGGVSSRRPVERRTSRAGLMQPLTQSRI